MSPPEIDPTCKSPGEWDLFHRLRDDPATADWYVIHSLDIADHRRQLTGEIDFVVIVPNRGVVCLEVKACRSLRREEGLWYYGATQHGDPRGPFNQVKESMFSLLDALRERHPECASVLFTSAVVFPFIAFGDTSVEWHRWQVIDSQALRRRPISQLVTHILEEARHQAELLPHGRGFVQPSITQCRDIRNALRSRIISSKDGRAIGELALEDARRYTEEQMDALDQLEANSRVIFEGPAGTGKTLLALEATRRARIAGRKVLLCCYNRFLGDWLAKEAITFDHDVVAGTIHGYMLAVAGISIPDRSDDRFWQRTLPAEAAIRVLDMADSGQWLPFDELIIDEGQDLLWDGYLDFFDTCLVGGLAAGRWRLFGDFEQAIFDTKARARLERLCEIRAPGVSRVRLRVNCRNTPRIAHRAAVFGGLNPGYSRVRRQDDGITPGLKFYHDDEGQQGELVNALDALTTEGFRGQDIVVLSAVRDEVSAAGRLNEARWAAKLRPWGKGSGDVPRYATIQAFKGMEAPAVVVTDIGEIFGKGESRRQASETLLYVATTRAIDRLVILAHERCRSDIGKLLDRLAVGVSPSTLWSSGAIRDS